MKKYASIILISIGALLVFIVSFNSVSAATLLNTYSSPSDCNSSWTTPVGCHTRSNYYNNNPYSYNNQPYNNNFYPYNNQYPNYSNNQQFSNTNGQATTPVVNNYYYKTNPVATKSTTSTRKTSISKTIVNNKSTISSANSTSKKATDKTNSSSSSTTEVNPVTTGLSNSGLAALSLQGSGGFLPSSFWQWLIIIVLILIIVILARLINKSYLEHKETKNPVH